MINVRIRDGLCPDPTTGEGGATEGDIRGSFSDIIDVIGVKDLASGHCAVTENSPAAMSVLVAPGIVYIPNADYDELDSNQVRFWEAIVTVSTAVTITANTSGSARVDLVCAKMDTAITPDEHASNIATLVAVAGTPGAGTPATPDNHYVLATVAVANGASTIINADITSTRVQSKIDFDFLPKATGAEINTGTSDVTIVTPKAIADSNVLVSSDNVALTSTAAELNALDGQTGSWTSYTPSLVGVVLGSGTNIGYYQKIGKTVHYRAKVTLASNSSITGVICVSPPTTVQNDASSPIGLATLLNANGSFYTGWLRQDGAVYIFGTDGVWSGTSATYPFTFETGDIIIVSGTYEAA